jgi:hypothetical protein
MRWFNWSEEYKRRPIMTSEEMLAAVEKLEQGYWPWLLFALTLHVLGFCLMLAGCFRSTQMLIVGGILALDGAILNGTLKIVAHVRLQGLRIMLQTENRMQAEMRRADALDL